jgi:hypothetical protein
VIHNRHNSSINLLERWTNDRSTFNAWSTRGTAGHQRRDPLTFTGNSIVNYDIAGNPLTGYGIVDNWVADYGIVDNWIAGYGEDFIKYI